jgi:hypothetical protein
MQSRSVRTGTPGRPATKVPMQVQVRATDLYGNTIPVRDSVYLEIDPGSPPFAVTGPTRLSVIGVALALLGGGSYFVFYWGIAFIYDIGRWGFKLGWY